MRSLNIEFVKLSDLTIDLTCQQPLRPAKVDKIMQAGFNPRFAGVIIVSRRENGVMVIIDGQHRVEAARRSGYDILQAEVFTGLTLAQEAEMFLGHNTKSNPTRISTFRVAVNAGAETETVINSILTRHGWRVREGTNGIKGVYRAVGAAYDVYALKGHFTRENHHVPGPSLFAETIRVLTESYMHEDESTHAYMVKGVAFFMQTYWEKADMDRLVAQLMTVKPSTLVAKMKAQKDALGLRQEVAGAVAVFDLYSDRLRVGKLNKMELFN